MDKKLQTRINNAIDKAIADFRADEEYIFANEKDTVKYKYRSLTSVRRRLTTLSSAKSPDFVVLKARLLPCISEDRQK